MTPITLAVLTFCAILTLAGAFAILVSDGLEQDDDDDEDILILPAYSAEAARFYREREQWRRTKEAAECCKEHALPDGRPVIGYCGPDCERRPRY